jgi:hypothetical protein
MRKVVNISPGLSVGLSSKTAIEVTRKAVEPDAVATGMVTTGEPWSRWGPRNKYPLDVIDENSQDTTSMGALNFKVAAHYGGGPMLFRKEYDDKGKEIHIPLPMEKYPMVEDFFFENDIENFLQSIIADFEWWNRYHVQYIPNKPKTRILKINSGIGADGSFNYMRTKDIRKAKRNPKTGQIPGFYHSGDWSEGQPQAAFLPAFNKNQPFKLGNAVYEHKVASISNDYYITPGWQANMRWLGIARKIQEWINANIDNSINIKYHIEIPQQYFYDLFPKDRYDTDEEWQAAMDEHEEGLKKSIDEALAGSKNASKTFYTKFAVDESGNPLPGWKFNVIKNEINDTAWLTADQVAASRILTAHGVPPSLAGIIISNTSSGSASDVREQFNYYLQMRTVMPRQTTTEWFYLVKRYNNWPKELHLGFKQIILQSLDQNKSGKAVENEPTPTSQNPM